MHLFSNHNAFSRCQTAFMAITLALSAGTAARADQFPADPVDELRKALALSIEDLTANDKELTDRLDAIKRMDGLNDKDRDKAVTQARTKARDKHLVPLVEAIKSIPDMRRALLLQEWRLDQDKDELTVVDRKPRGMLLDRFTIEIQTIFKSGTQNRKLATIDMVVATGIYTRTPLNTSGVGRPFGPVLANLTKNDSSPQIREAAARALGQTFPEPELAVAALSEMLGSTNVTERRAATNGLLGLISTASLLASGKQAATKVEAKSADVLTVGRLAVVALGPALKDPDLEVRKLGLDAVKQAAATLLQPLTGEDVNADIVKSTEQFKKDLLLLMSALRDQCPSLAAAVNDSDVNVRILARKALEEIGYARQHLLRQEGLKIADQMLPGLKTALPALIKGVGDSNAAARLVAVETLETIGTHAAEAAPTLVSALADKDRFVRWAAARSLGEVAPAAASSAVPALGKMLSDPDSDLVRAATVALGRFGPLSEKALPDLIRLLGAADVELKVSAMQTIESIGTGSTPALPALIASLGDSDARVREAAAKVLGKFGPRGSAAEPALRKTLDDSNIQVRREASDALLRILQE